VRTTAFVLLASSLSLATSVGAGAGDSLRVRASPAASPCTEAAGREWQAVAGRRVAVEAGALRDEGDWDVLVGSSVELTRALEGGAAAFDSDVEVASIPWVLHLSADAPIRDLDDLARSGVEPALLAGDAAYEARRALAEHKVGRVRETSDSSRLRAAPVALVPLSLAGSGRRVAVDVPPIRVGAAVGARAHRPDDASAFVRYLGSEAGQQAFAACAPSQ
jgi:hypothetical protein